MSEKKENKDQGLNKKYLEKESLEKAWDKFSLEKSQRAKLKKELEEREIRKKEQEKIQKEQEQFVKNIRKFSFSILDKNLVKKIVLAVGVSIVVIFLIFIIRFFKADSITNREASSICARVLFNEVTQRFRVVSSSLNNKAGLNTARSSIDIMFFNGKKATISCDFEKKIVGGKVVIKNATMFDTVGNKVEIGERVFPIK